MMVGWRKCKLRDVIASNVQSINKDYPHKTIQYLDTGSITCGKIESYQEIMLENTPSRAKRLVREHDIIYSTVRPIQRHYGFIVNPPANLVVSTGFSVIKTNRELAEPLFIYNFLTSNEIVEVLDVIADGSTSAYPSLKPSDIENLDILLPPLPEQKAIASVLSSLDGKIDLLHRQNKTLEAMAQTLFRQWFVEEAQEDWQDGKFPDEFDYVMGASPPGESYNETGVGIPMFQGNADFEFRFPKRRIFTTDPKKFAEKYDTLVSVRAPVGAQNMANEKCCIGRGVAAFRYKRNNGYYTYTYFKMKSLMKEIQSFNDTGTVFGSISKADFEAFEIIIPPSELVDRCQAEIKPIDDKVITNIIQIHTLEKLRDTLLPKLMSGEVQVKYEAK
ncbi:restriction endonuclease subunit S [Desulfobacterium sp. N47]|uniref:restriction endonuclease subunit S n=1 Tax=Desulfobacterium sp. N47 TaxID=3115210 RepID=UPI003F4A0E13